MVYIVRNAFLFANVGAAIWWLRYLLMLWQISRKGKQVIGVSTFLTTTIEFIVMTILCGIGGNVIRLFGNIYYVHVPFIIMAIVGIVTYFILLIIASFLGSILDSYFYSRHLSKRQIEMGKSLSAENVEKARKDIMDKLKDK